MAAFRQVPPSPPLQQEQQQFAGVCIDTIGCVGAAYGGCLRNCALLLFWQ